MRMAARYVAHAVRMTKKVIHVGTGGWGAWWAMNFLPPNVADGTVEVIAAVDVEPANHVHATEHLGLGADRLFTHAAAAFDAFGDEADFVTVVVPPWAHEEVVVTAVERGLPVLCEKPMADSLAAAHRMVAAVERSGVAAAVTMSHRFDQDKATFRAAVRAADSGPLDYLVHRFTCDLRKFGQWGSAFRHEMDDPLLVEGGVHHLDILDDLAGGTCVSVFARTWRPAWAEYAGDCNALVTLEYDNGVNAHYEGAKANATTLNGWSNDYIRAECRDATVVLDKRRVERFRWAPEAPPRQVDAGDGEPVPFLDGVKWSNALLVQQFAAWLDGGPPLETSFDRNLRSLALVFAAIESSRRKQAVDPAEVLEAARP
jgi:predicted dehydrogenase